MNDETILNRGGTEEDVKEYAANEGGASLTEDDFHLEICEQCRIPGTPYRSWYCVPCDRIGYGFGCPKHAHVEDNSVIV